MQKMGNHFDRSILKTLLLLILSIAFLPSNARATHSHEEYDFETDPGPSWSSQATVPSLLGGSRLLGPFDNESVTHTILDALPAGDNPRVQFAQRTVRMSWELHLWGDWQGNMPGSESVFQMSINGTPLLLTTFSTTAELQYFPNQIGGSYSPSGSGAGLFLPGFVSIYRLEHSFPLYSLDPQPTDLILDFSASGLGTAASWQLDNIVLDWSHVVPEPTAFSLCVLGTGVPIAWIVSRNRGRLVKQSG